MKGKKLTITPIHPRRHHIGHAIKLHISNTERLAFIPEQPDELLTGAAAPHLETQDLARGLDVQEAGEPVEVVGLDGTGGGVVVLGQVEAGHQARVGDVGGCCGLGGSSVWVRCQYMSGWRSEGLGGWDGRGGIDEMEMNPQ